MSSRPLGPEGLISGADPEMGWRHLTQSHPMFGVLSVHTVPAERFVHHIDQVGSCMCDPEMVAVENLTGMSIPHVAHHALDRRYYPEPDVDVYTGP